MPPSFGPISTYWADRVARGELTPGTADRYRRVLASFRRFAASQGHDSFTTIDPLVCRAFVIASRAGRPPARSTSRLRLSAIRDAFLALQLADMVAADPTEGLHVGQSNQARIPVPLTPTEALTLRSAGRASPRDQLRPTTVELALAGGSHLEVATAVVVDVDLVGRTVRFGSRSIDLEPIAISKLAARIASCRLTSRRFGDPWDPGVTSLALSRPIHTYPETSVAPSVSSNLSRAMANAGLARAGLRPASVREYAANRRYALTNRVEDVATFLGLESLDVARGFIDPAWQDRYGGEVRALDGSRS